MRKDEIINEMPIRVHNVNVNRDDEVSSFQKDDQTLLNSDKAIQKIKRIWNSSVAEVDLYTINVGVDPETAIDIAIDGYKVGVSPEDNERISDIHQANGIQFDKKAISVILTNNEGAARLPLTGWMIAHRLYHSFEMDRISPHHTSNMESLGPNMRSIASKIYVQYNAVVGFDLENYCLREPYLSKFARSCLLGSTKACRDFKLSTDFEFIPECFAQYMLRGSVKLRPLPREPFTIQGETYTPAIENYSYCAKEVEHFENFLNRTFAELIEAAKGRIVAI